MTNQDEVREALEQLKNEEDTLYRSKQQAIVDIEEFYEDAWDVLNKEKEILQGLCTHPATTSVVTYRPGAVSICSVCDKFLRKV